MQKDILLPAADIFQNILAVADVCEADICDADIL
jgi:hypothetical protein